MSKYLISNENRKYLDAILPDFNLDHFIDIQNVLKKNLRVSNSTLKKMDIYKPSVEIASFLISYHFADGNVKNPLINRKGMDLADCKSLAAYEEKERIEEEKLNTPLMVDKNIKFNNKIENSNISNLSEMRDKAPIKTFTKVINLLLDLRKIGKRK